MKRPRRNWQPVVSGNPWKPLRPRAPRKGPRRTVWDRHDHLTLPGSLTVTWRGVVGHFEPGFLFVPHRYVSQGGLK